MTDAELRSLAEAAQRLSPLSNAGREAYRVYEAASRPDVVLSLLDRLAASISGLEAWCPICGDMTRRQDEDGCCCVCGADLVRPEIVAKIRATASTAAPIPMRLTCPTCGELHLDVGEFADKPHHTHACQSCGAVWRPAVVCTVGVRYLPGFKNEAADAVEPKEPP